MNVPAGTEIYDPGHTTSPAAYGEATKGAKIEVTSNAFVGYVLLKRPGILPLIPYGIDYVSNNHFGSKLSLYCGFGLTSIGTTVMLAGAIPLLSAGDDEDAQTTESYIVLTGAAAALIGIPLALPAQSRLQQTAYDYNFGYAKKQQVNLPELSMKLLHPNPSKEELASSKSVKTERKKASSRKTVKTEDESSKSGSKVSRVRGDASKKIAGEYVGNGKLMLKGTTDETLSSVQVIIESVDKNHVKVRIIESGEDFFEDPLIYVVTTNKKGDYTLVIEDLPEATINITKKGALIFLHKRVLIDDDVYSLSINGNKI